MSRAALEIRANALAKTLVEPIAGEAANVATHATGLVLGLLALAFLVRFTSSALGTEKAEIFWSSVVYGVTLVCVYAASTFYHAERNRRRKCVLEVADHAAIYLLIAGTFTPFGVQLGTGFGRALLVAEWCLAVVGILFKAIFGCRRYIAISVATYLLMGWGPILLIVSIFHATSAAAVEWLIIGGLCYTAGVPIFVLSHKKPHVHALWHISVMLGSASHFIAVFYCIQPRITALTHV